MFLSKIINKLPVQWGKTIVIKQLVADPLIISSIKESLRQKKPNASEEEVDNEVHQIVLRDNYYNGVMDEISRSYKIEFNTEEIADLIENFKQNANYQDMNAERLEQTAKITIIKALIYADLASQWNIQITDDYTKKTLQEYYRQTNESINDYLSDREKFEEIKKTLLEQVIADRLLNAFKPHFDLEEVKQAVNNEVKN